MVVRSLPSISDMSLLPVLPPSGDVALLLSEAEGALPWALGVVLLGGVVEDDGEVFIDALPPLLAEGEEGDGTGDGVVDASTEDDGAPGVVLGPGVLLLGVTLLPLLHFCDEYSAETVSFSA